MSIDLKAIVEHWAANTPPASRVAHTEEVDLARQVAAAVLDEAARRLVNVPCSSAEMHEITEQIVALQRELCGNKNNSANWRN